MRFKRRFKILQYSLVARSNTLRIPHIPKSRRSLLVTRHWNLSISQTIVRMSARDAASRRVKKWLQFQSKMTAWLIALSKKIQSYKSLARFWIISSTCLHRFRRALASACLSKLNTGIPKWISQGRCFSQYELSPNLLPGELLFRSLLPGVWILSFRF